MRTIEQINRNRANNASSRADKYMRTIEQIYANNREDKYMRTIEQIMQTIEQIMQAVEQIMQTLEQIMQTIEQILQTVASRFCLHQLRDFFLYLIERFYLVF